MTYQGKEESLIELFDDMLKSNMSNYYMTFHPKAAERFGGKYGIRPLFTNEPKPLALPYMWKYREAKSKLYQLSELISAEESERRTVIFVNPGLKNINFFGLSSIAPTLYGGLQLIKAGERAPAHRHTPVNVRFVLEAPEKGAYIIYDGFKVDIGPGDVLVQSNWMLHDHHNNGNTDLIWLAGLDSPFVSYLSAMFYEGFVTGGVDEEQPIKSAGDVLTETYGSSLRPSRPLVSHDPWYNPVIKYPWRNILRSLTYLHSMGNLDQHEGVSVELTNPLSGGPALPTIRITTTLIPPKTDLYPLRRTENMVLVNFDGEIVVEVMESIDGKKTFHLADHDVVVLPTWTKYRLSNRDDRPAILFTYSDAPIYKSFGLYREIKFEGTR